MRTVQVYIEGQRLDLFDDETINVTSTQQNVQDISKVFTDFSQSFSVPASVNNNQIFEHFYENDINSTLDYNIRRNANIEIDYTPFRTGKISLEKAEVKNNRSYSYQITFYGDVVSLKDKFGDRKLSDIKFLNTFTHAYNGTEVKNRITDGNTDYNIRYPLIGQRKFTFGDGGANDINPVDGTTSISFSELFPALKIKAIFTAIENEYDVTFNGTFLSDKRFTNCFLFCQNKLEHDFLTDTTDLDFTTISSTILQNPPNPYNPQTYIDLTANSIQTVFLPALEFGRHRVTITCTSQSAVGTYFIEVYRNNAIVNIYSATTPQPITVLNIENLEGLDETYTFKIKANNAMNLDFTVNYSIVGFFDDPSTGDLQQATNFSVIQTNTVALTADIGILNYLPDMKVEEFFSGVLKEFNLTCYSTEADIYQIEPLSEWYDKGSIVDVTEYTDIESINVNRVKLYKNIEFNYVPSENILNTAFKELFDREYGDTKQTFDYDGGDFKIEVPFENMMQERFTGTALQVGYTLNKDLQKYIPKPLLLYMYDETTASFPFHDGTSVSILTEYMPFGQDVIDTNVNFTLNFNAEISTFTLQTEHNTLFAVYYQAYLLNLYNLKNRETSVKTNLPISLLTSLQLNDRLIIRDKRYIINDMKSNLTTGEVDFVLLSDFTDVLAQGGSKPIQPLQPSDGSQCVDVRILFPNGAVSATIATTDAGVTITPSTLTTDGTVSVCIPANTDTLKLIVSEDDADNINTEDFIRLRTEEGTVAIYTLTVTYTFADGTTAANQIFIQQQP